MVVEFPNLTVYANQCDDKIDVAEYLFPHSVPTQAVH